MLKYTFFTLFIPGILIGQNLNENLKPVSEGKSKSHVSKGDVKNKYSQDKYLISETSKINFENLKNEYKTHETSKRDRNDLMADYKKTTEKKSSFKKESKKERFEESRRGER